MAKPLPRRVLLVMLDVAPDRPPCVYSRGGDLWQFDDLDEALARVLAGGCAAADCDRLPGGDLVIRRVVRRLVPGLVVSGSPLTVNPEAT